MIKIKMLTTFLSLLFIFFYATGLVNFIPDKLLVNIPNYILYSLYGLSLLVALYLSIVSLEIRRQAILIGSLIFILILQLIWSGDFVSDPGKNYLINLVTIFLVVILCLKSNRSLVNLIIISVALMGALLCLIDIVFYDGYTNTTGRAAGLFINPNIAASVLLLLSVASVPLIHKNWRVSFIILMAGAILSTVSRSSIVVGISVLLSACMIDDLRKYINKNSLYNCFWVCSFIFVIGMAAMWNNKSYSVAIKNSIGSIYSAAEIFNSAREKIKLTEEKFGPAETPAAPEPYPSSPLAAAPPPAASPHPDNFATKEEIATILSDVEKVNSASVRLLKAEQAISVFKMNPIWGSGISNAYQLSTHNSYLLLSVAFGVGGFLIFITLPYLLYLLSGVYSIPFTIALMGISFFSHDIFFVNLYSVVLAVCIYSLLQSNTKDEYINNRIIRLDILTIIILTIILAVGFFGIRQAKILISNSYFHEISGSNVIELETNVYYSPLPVSRSSGVVAIDTSLIDPNFDHSIFEGKINLYFCNESDYFNLKHNEACYYNDSSVVFYDGGYENLYDADKKYIFFSKLKIHWLFIITLLLFNVWLVFVLIFYKRLIK